MHDNMDDVTKFGTLQAALADLRDRPASETVSMSCRLTCWRWRKKRAIAYLDLLSRATAGYGLTCSILSEKVDRRPRWYWRLVEVELVVTIIGPCVAVQAFGTAIGARVGE